MILRQHSRVRRLIVHAVAVGFALLTQHAMADKAGSSCAPIAIPGHYGPYNYVTENGKIKIVEQFHFTPKVEALIGGQSGYLGDDLSYTLNASPNHHRALAAIMRYGARTKSPQPPHLAYSIECYFDRAVRFSPKDTVVRGLYAEYLANLKRPAEAIQQLDAASEFADDNPVSHYNLGLVYFDLGQYDQALREEHAARKLGYEGAQLSAKLKSVGRWKEQTD